MTTDRPLTLDVTDCGPVAQACVELRPLTVFVGAVEIASKSHAVRNSARILLRHAVEGVSTPAVHELTFGDGTWEFLSTGRGSEIQPRLEWEAIGTLADSVLPSHRPAFYLPADRTGLMNAHSTVVSALIQSATMGGIRRADPLPPLSGVRGDFLEQLVEMVSDQRRRFRRDREPLRRLGKRIEDGILGGAVKVGGLPHRR